MSPCVSDRAPTILDACSSKFEASRGSVLSEEGGDGVFPVPVALIDWNGADGFGNIEGWSCCDIGSLLFIYADEKRDDSILASCFDTLQLKQLTISCPPGGLYYFNLRNEWRAAEGNKYKIGYAHGVLILEATPPSAFDFNLAHYLALVVCLVQANPSFSANHALM